MLHMAWRQQHVVLYFTQKHSTPSLKTGVEPIRQDSPPWNLYIRIINLSTTRALLIWLAHLAQIRGIPSISWHQCLGRKVSHLRRSLTVWALDAPVLWSRVKSTWGPSVEMVWCHYLNHGRNHSKLMHVLRLFLRQLNLHEYILQLACSAKLWRKQILNAINQLWRVWHTDCSLSVHLFIGEQTHIQGSKQKSSTYKSSWNM
jgi:hypothetical protein